MNHFACEKCKEINRSEGKKCTNCGAVFKEKNVVGDVQEK